MWGGTKVWNWPLWRKSKNGYQTKNVRYLKREKALCQKVFLCVWYGEQGCIGVQPIKAVFGRWRSEMTFSLPSIVFHDLFLLANLRKRNLRISSRLPDQNALNISMVQTETTPSVSLELWPQYAPSARNMSYQASWNIYLLSKRNFIDIKSNSARLLWTSCHKRRPTYCERFIHFKVHSQSSNTWCFQAYWCKSVSERTIQPQLKGTGQCQQWSILRSSFKSVLIDC